MSVVVVNDAELRAYVEQRVAAGTDEEIVRWFGTVIADLGAVLNRMGSPCQAALLPTLAKFACDGCRSGVISANDLRPQLVNYTVTLNQALTKLYATNPRAYIEFLTTEATCRESADEILRHMYGAGPRAGLPS